MDYYQIPAERLGVGAAIPIRTLGDSGEVFYELALEMLACVRACASAGKPAVLIVPVGPVGQYPIFVRLVNETEQNLQHVWFINMDEYLTPGGDYIAMDDPLSFRGYMEREVYGRIRPDLLMPVRQRVFPNPGQPGAVTELLERMGGADLCVGGLGINGHVAFNEPQEMEVDAFSALPTRVVEIDARTRTTCAIGDLGGAEEAVPRLAVTVGMREILSAKKIRIGVFRDWHRAVLRRAAYGSVSAEFPATLLQDHPDAMIYTNAAAAARPFAQRILLETEGMADACHCGDV